MNRPLAFTCICWLALSQLGLLPARADKPNVLLICVDDLKPQLGCYGDPIARSPNIDALAARGVLFERAYCNQAVCAPSRNALLTGLRSTTLGIYDLGTNFRKSRPDAITLPQIFKQHGYRTEGLGKIFHVGHGNHEDPASWSVPHWKTNVIAYAKPESKAASGLTREEALFDNQPAQGLPKGPLGKRLMCRMKRIPMARWQRKLSSDWPRPNTSPINLSSWRSALSNRTCRLWHRKSTGTCTIQPNCRWLSGKSRPKMHRPMHRSTVANSDSIAISRARCARARNATAAHPWLLCSHELHGRTGWQGHR